MEEIKRNKENTVIVLNMSSFVIDTKMVTKLQNFISRSDWLSSRNFFQGEANFIAMLIFIVMLIFLLFWSRFQGEQKSLRGDCLRGSPLWRKATPRSA